MTRDVILYTRKQCNLCDETAAELRRLRDELRFTLQELDVDEDVSLREQYNDIVPVVALGDRVIAHAPVDLAELRRTLAEALPD
ncbi:MAG: glutaredoxin family protein [Dehalococcoidia bacterium]